MAKVDLSQPALLFLEVCKNCTISPHEMKLYLKDRHILKHSDKLSLKVYLSFVLIIVLKNTLFIRFSNYVHDYFLKPVKATPYC